MTGLFAPIRDWFRTPPATESESQLPVEREIDWIRAVPFVAMHLACLLVFWVGWSWFAIGVAVALYVIRMIAITGFYHRYFSHRSFNTSRWCQFLFAVLGCCAAQKGPLWWAAHHRYHHQVSDQEADIHSPYRHGFLWSHVGWVLSKRYFRTNMKAVGDLARYPELVFLDRFDMLIPLLLGAFLYALGFVLETAVPSLGTNGSQLLLWGFFISTVVLFHATCTINSLSHQIGRKRFDTGDESRNSLLLALITLGEWHNNHHHYPASTQQGFRWWEIDLTYTGLRLLSRTGLIWGVKPVPASIANHHRRAV